MHGKSTSHGIVRENEWLQRERRRVLLQVVYYRIFDRLPVMALSSGRVVAFDKK